jgi:thiol-disulfide isomerase/thioredoxin
MRTLVLAILLFLALNSYAQHNLYTFNNGEYLETNKLKLLLDTAKKSLPPTYDLTGTIYHKIAKNDTVINYIIFSATNKTSTSTPATLQFDYKQDSLFLLLNKKLPAFTLKDLDGKEVSLNSLLGKPTLINFWATSCGPCIAEMPQLSRLKEKYQEQMNFVSITENNAANDHLHEFLKNKDFNFVVMQDGELYKRKLKISAIPKNLFLDKNGTLISIQGNYPIDTNSKPIAINDKNNYFIKLIDGLIGKTK